MGDFNPRTGGLNDVFPDDVFFERYVGIDALDDRVDMDLLENLGIQQRRANQDRASNNNGRQLVDICREHGLLIANGRVGQDRGIGKKTCFNRNHGTSAIDLVIASPELFPCFSNFEVQEFSEYLSDTHCPIVLNLHNTVVESVEREAAAQGVSHNSYKFVWTPDSGAELRNGSSDQLAEELSNLLDHLEASPSQEGVDSFAEKIF